MSYLTSELGVDVLDVSLSAIILQLHTNGPRQLHPDRPRHLVHGGNQLLSLLYAAARVEDGPDIQWDLWNEMSEGGEETNFDKK